MSSRPSYRALLAVPSLPRVIVSMQLARLAQAMVGIALVLFTLQAYGSPALAGVVTFASIFPGLLVSPIAGALLDRHGRIRLVALDYLVALSSLVLIGGLSAAGALPAPLLVAITVVSSLTGILSATGLRSLFPILVPRPLWERANAVDSNGYVIATILGPPVAAALVAFAGPQAALLLIAIPFGLAVIAIIGFHEPRTETSSSGRLFADAWAGLRYTLRNPTLRGLGLSITVANLTSGMTTIVIPVIVIRELGYSDAVVGLAYAVSGLSGLVSTFFFGRFDTRGREWGMLVIPMLLFAPPAALLWPASGALGPIAPAAGLALIVVGQFLFGLINGPLDIALFTLRQRRTDQAMLGRAFAVSMAFNFMGFPIGSAVTGVIIGTSVVWAIGFGVVAAVVSAVLAAFLIPRRDPDESDEPGEAVVATPA